MNETSKTRFKFVEDTILGVVILIILTWFIYDSVDNNTFNEYYLITKEKTTVRGNIVEAKKFEDEIEKNNHQTIETVSGYNYTYVFTLPNMEKVIVKSGNYGRLPLDKNIWDIPYQVEIEYLSNNPNINRLKGVWSSNRTLFDWFRQELLLGFLIIIFVLYFVYKIFNRGIINYKERERVLKIIENRKLK